jgi:isopropylmalate/homocitrate/citramalate synthase
MWEIGIDMVIVLDATLREGELQPGIYFDRKTRADVAIALGEAGVHRIELPLMYASRGGSIEELSSLTRDLHSRFSDLEVIVQCRAFLDDVEKARQLEVDGCAVFLGITQEHRRHKLEGMRQHEAIERLVSSIEALKDYGFRYRRAVLEDVSRFFSEDRGAEDTIEFLTQIIRAVCEAGASVISIPDTSGIIPHRKVRGFFEVVKAISTVPLAAHFHNDYGNALANALEAILAGAEEVHVSILGIGSRNGITDHYELVSNLEDLYGIRTGEKRDRIMELYLKFENATGIPIPWRHPLSALCNIEKGGTHQAQVVRSPVGYIPAKKLVYDFGGQAYFEAGRFISKHVIAELLAGYKLNKGIEARIAEAIARRSCLRQRSLTAHEVRDIIRLESGIELPIEKVQKLIRGSEQAYLVLNIKPQYSGREIVDAVSRWPEVFQADEVYGDADIVILSKLRDSNGRSVVDKVKERFGEAILRISAWILE